MKNNQTIAQFLGIKTFPFEIKNDQGEEIYFETSIGNWSKRQYDAKGNRIHYENSRGFWAKREYDANGNVIYFENSDGTVRDNRPKQTELTLTEIAEKLNIPVEQLRINLVD